ncbi:MAG TPA: hypothetical protein VL306_00080 [Methylomirabilota bacterium]|nr:hypothetical protein [Methylomirabilota bacterium]
MLESINEPIEVMALFKLKHTMPNRFWWQGKEIVIQKINLAYSKREGRNKFYFFAVTDGANYFKLQLNAESLTWTLLETYVE